MVTWNFCLENGGEGLEILEIMKLPKMGDDSLWNGVALTPQGTMYCIYIYFWKNLH